VSNRLALPVRRAQSGTWHAGIWLAYPRARSGAPYPRLGRPRALPGQALGPQSGEARRRHRVTSGAPGGSVPRIPLLSRRHATAHPAARLKLDQRIEQVDRRERTSRMCVFGPVTLWLSSWAAAEYVRKEPITAYPGKRSRGNGRSRESTGSSRQTRRRDRCRSSSRWPRPRRWPPSR
jgi:hypothetical protein